MLLLIKVYWLLAIVKANNGMDYNYFQFSIEWIFCKYMLNLMAKYILKKFVTSVVTGNCFLSWSFYVFDFFFYKMWDFDENLPTSIEDFAESVDE